MKINGLSVFHFADTDLLNGKIGFYTKELESAVLADFEISSDTKLKPKKKGKDEEKESENSDELESEPIDSISSKTVKRKNFFMQKCFIESNSNNDCEGNDSDCHFQICKKCCWRHLKGDFDCLKRCVDLK